VTSLRNENATSILNRTEPTVNGTPDVLPGYAWHDEKDKQPAVLASGGAECSITSVPRRQEVTLYVLEGQHKDDQLH
jgi:hypothetical protein